MNIKAYVEGYDAYCEGVDVSDNPYDESEELNGAATDEDLCASSRFTGCAAAHTTPR